MGNKAIVTGGSRGIGRGIALALASEGYDLAITYARKREAAESVAEEIRSRYGRECHCYQASLEIPGVAHDMFVKAVADLGGLDLLVNNAGLTICESIQNITEEKLDHLLNLDFRTFVILMRDATRYMIDHKIKGNIVNITSSRGERAYPECGIYCGLKAGLIHAIKAFALDVSAYGIRINNVAPGATRIRTKAEIAAMTTGEASDYFWREEYEDKTKEITSGFKGDNISAAVKRSGNLLFASNRGHDSIAVFRIQADGTLTPTGIFPSGGRTPRDFEIFGDFLVAANQDSDSLTVSKLDRRRGSLSLTDLGAGLVRPCCICRS